MGGGRTAFSYSTELSRGALPRVERALPGRCVRSGFFGIHSRTRIELARWDPLRADRANGDRIDRTGRLFPRMRCRRPARTDAGGTERVGASLCGGQRGDALSRRFSTRPAPSRRHPFQWRNTRPPNLTLPVAATDHAVAGGAPTPHTF